MRRRLTLWIFISLWLGLVLTAPVVAQDGSQLTLRVNKLMGFNMGSQIQGTFKLSVQGPDTLQQVTFKLDDVTLAEDSMPPFEARFNTDAYAPGWHTFSAEGRLSTGEILYAPARHYEFVTGEAAWKAIQAIIVPVMALVLGIMLIGTLVTFLGSRETSGEIPVRYGLLGGAVCPVCHKPYARHWWGLNLGPGLKLDRCPHCQSWRVTRRASPQELEAAAEMWRAQEAKDSVAPRSQTDWEQELDASRYTQL